jgi:hypothetical protein
MQFQKFQKIRSGLHFNDNEMDAGMNEALHKAPPLVSIVEVTICAFIQIGSEVVLDEASVASQLSYGWSLILFNPIKKCGQFHFRCYLLCCSTTYACVKINVATKNNSDNPDPKESMGTIYIYNTTRMSKLNKLVMEMCKSLFGSKRTVNIKDRMQSGIYVWIRYQDFIKIPAKTSDLDLVCVYVNGVCGTFVFPVCNDTEGTCL